jgi:peptidoglycan/xylan/chitin deacetylase (PgdA/CDA1 family)
VAPANITQLKLSLTLLLPLLALAQVPDSVAPVTAAPVLDSVDLSSRTVVISIDDGYHSVFTAVYPALKRHGYTMTLALITDYVGQGKSSYRPSSRFMNRTEIQELIDSCAIEVASHSQSHPFLTKLDSAAAWSEISGSKAIIESLFGQDVYTFVYPYGDVDARIRRFARRAGYRLGRAVRPGDPNFWADPFRLPCYELRKETPLSDAKRYISSHKITILLLHQVTDIPVSFTQWSRSDFDSLLGWLDRGDARVTTLSALYREWWLKKLAEFMDEVARAFPDRRKTLLFEDVNIDITGTSHPR